MNESTRIHGNCTECGCVSQYIRNRIFGMVTLECFDCGHKETKPEKVNTPCPSLKNTHKNYIPESKVGLLD